MMTEASKLYLERMRKLRTTRAQTGSRIVLIRGCNTLKSKGLRIKDQVSENKEQGSSRIVFMRGAPVVQHHPPKHSIYTLDFSSYSFWLGPIGGMEE